MNSPSCSRCVTKSIACIYELPPSNEGVIPTRAALVGNSSQSSVANVAERSPAALSPDRIRLPTGMELENASASPFDQMISELPIPFAIRWPDNKQFSLNRSYVLCTLKSYPYMLLPERDPPPFIHPHSAFGTYESSSGVVARRIRQPPLQNCAAIVRWHSVRDIDNTVFIGNTMRVETERLLKEVRWLYVCTCLRDH